MLPMVATELGMQSPPRCMVLLHRVPCLLLTLVSGIDMPAICSDLGFHCLGGSLRPRRVLSGGGGAVWWCWWLLWGEMWALSWVGVVGAVVWLLALLCCGSCSYLLAITLLPCRLLMLCCTLLCEHLVLMVVVGGVGVGEHRWWHSGKARTSDPGSLATLVPVGPAAIVWYSIG